MPYITQAERDRLDVGINHLNGVIQTSGDLNYVVTKLMLHYSEEPKSKYVASVMSIGTVVCAMLEFYRRFTAPYEDKKIKENGDVY